MQRAARPNAHEASTPRTQANAASQSSGERSSPASPTQQPRMRTPPSTPAPTPGPSKLPASTYGAGDGTGWCHEDLTLLHEHPGSQHPESPSRVQAAVKAIIGLESKLVRVPGRLATDAEILAVHTEEVMATLDSTSALTSSSARARNRQLERDKSLFVNEHTSTAARMACGSVIDLCVAVARGDVRNGFAVVRCVQISCSPHAVRPPGHHATPNESMGFCHLNNVAVATEVLLRGRPDLDVKCVMILDWDIHHGAQSTTSLAPAVGNSTQKAFENDPNVLYVSLHRYDNGHFYPGTGDSTETGGLGALGKTVNIAWNVRRYSQRESFGTEKSIDWERQRQTDSDGLSRPVGDADYVYALHRLVLPVARAFKPDVVLGFDAAHGDWVGGCHVTPDGFGRMVASLLELAMGKVVLVLEGGYDLDSLTLSVTSCVSALLGDPPSHISPHSCLPTVTGVSAVLSTLRAHHKYLPVDIRLPAATESPLPIPKPPPFQELPWRDAALQLVWPVDGLRRGLLEYEDSDRWTTKATARKAKTNEETAKRNAYNRIRERTTLLYTRDDCGGDDGFEEKYGQRLLSQKMTAIRSDRQAAGLAATADRL